MAELRQQQITAAQLENRAILEARAAIQRYERARRLVEQSVASWFCPSRTRWNRLKTNSRRGRSRCLEVFAARTALAQSRQSLFDLLNELALAAADVTQATGLPPQQLCRGGPRTPRGPLEEVPRP